MRSFKIALLIAALLLLAGLQTLAAEVRAIWVLPWSTNTQEKIVRFMEDAAAARQTDIFIEVRYRADALYQTNRAEDAFPNPEPRSHLLKGSDFDPLACALREGHKRNLRVHAWFVVFNATPVDTTLIRENYIYRRHPDWFTVDRHGKRPSAASQSGYFVDPGVPAVQDHIIAVIGDLVSGYPQLDGLHLDYVRYPSAALGFHPVSLRMKQATEASRGMNWNEWRVSQVTSFVERTAALLDSLSPHLTLSAAVIPEYGRAVGEYAQDWQDWLRRGLVDYAYPMAYQANLGNFTNTLNDIGAMGLNDRIVVGIRAWRENGGSLTSGPRQKTYSLDDVTARIDAVRQLGFAGVSLFSYDGLATGNALPQLAELSYSERTIAELSAQAGQSELATAVPDLPEVRFVPSARSYRIELTLPDEGRWHWQLSGPDRQGVYQRAGYYLRGANLDLWNGYLDDESQIPPGDYILGLFRERDGYEYLLPVHLAGVGI